MGDAIDFVGLIINTSTLSPFSNRHALIKVKEIEKTNIYKRKNAEVPETLIPEGKGRA